MPSDSAPTAIWTSPSFSEFPNHIVGASVYFVCEGSMKITFNEALLVRFGEFPNHIVGASGASGASRRTGTHRDAAPRAFARARAPRARSPRQGSFRVPTVTGAHQSRRRVLGLLWGRLGTSPRGLC